MFKAYRTLCDRCADKKIEVEVVSVPKEVIFHSRVAKLTKKKKKGDNDDGSDSDQSDDNNSDGENNDKDKELADVTEDPEEENKDQPGT